MRGRGEPRCRPHFSLDEATGSTGHLGETATAGESAVGTGKVQVIPTDVETIDGLVADYSVKPNVIKMDIEGGEAQALEGASRTVAECRPVVVSELTGDGGPRSSPGSHGTAIGCGTSNRDEAVDAGRAPVHDRRDPGRGHRRRAGRGGSSSVLDASQVG